jgi:SEC-C motif-containing protein
MPNVISQHEKGVVMNNCPCGSENEYTDCCEPVIKGARVAQTAEQLMRARYSAYSKEETDFLLTSLHPDYRDEYDEAQAKQWAADSSWKGLEIVKIENGGKEDESGTVEFIASYSLKNDQYEHHELAEFKKQDNAWYFTDGASVPPKQVKRSAPKIGRNDPCPCNSGKKYKKCCGR